MAAVAAGYQKIKIKIQPGQDVEYVRAVRTLMAEQGLRRGLYAGDDATDLDEFRGLDGLDLAVRVAVVSDESPEALREAADVVVFSTSDFLELLRCM